uniref:Acetolactate synthase catalytic subunit n=1 Tax=Coccidioides posadasii RMSCC 3488 TaxID=454284 RepID=A0A0J6FBY3_COCPO|nr:acetolactate synthase catalytic subunit [Coccidioides posadasii RMSCC 3488]
MWLAANAMGYTASDALLEALWDAGIRYIFANLGSDHPAILEAFIKAQHEKNGQVPKIITCPNEMVALSMADGYARLSNKPQCVLIHTDVGTQALAAAVHNASCGRAPVLIIAGLSPFTMEGEMRGSRTEYIHWIQDVPDQKQIVSQYCRYSAEIKTGKNIKQVVNRALQFATSDPTGPSYLVAAREVLEEEIEPYKIEQKQWGAVRAAALPQEAVATIATELASAKEPLIIVGYTGRYEQAVTQLVQLADNIKGVRVLETGGSDMCFPANHPSALGLRHGVHDAIKTADVILVVDCDVPWIPTQVKPTPSAKIFHVDVDPLKQQMPLFYLKASETYRADATTAFKQLNEYISSSKKLTELLSAEEYTLRRVAIEASHKERIELLAEQAAKPQGINSPLNPAFLFSELRKACPPDTIWAMEAVTLAAMANDHIQASLPKSWINCGGGGLGWSGGGALGVKLASDDQHGGPGKGKFVCHIAGDGAYLFTVPSSVYWIARRYNIPILTIVLNNKGWNAPRHSLLLVHPNEGGARVTNEELNISFAPTPDYAGIAKAAAGGELWAGRAGTVEELAKALPEAIKSVLNGKGAVLEAQLNGKEGKYTGSSDATAVPN